MVLSTYPTYHFNLKWEYVLTGLVIGLLMIILPFEIMENFFKDIYGSFNNRKNEGMSARKLTAFAFVLFSGYIHIKHVNHDNAVEALIVDGCISLLCLGIVTAGNIIELKNGSKNSNPPDIPE
jgi:xanthine/uracil permease